MDLVHVLGNVQEVCLAVLGNVDINNKIGREYITVHMNAKMEPFVPQVLVVTINPNIPRVHAVSNVQEVCLAVLDNVDINKEIGREFIIVLMNAMEAVEVAHVHREDHQGNPVAVGLNVVLDVVKAVNV